MQQTLEYLYDRFRTGMKPTQQDFRDLMDSFFHRADLDAALQRLERISLGDGEAWQVDAALDEGSIQPVQNKAVAKRLNQLAQSISTTNSDLSKTMTKLGEAITTLGTKADQSDLDTLRGTVEAFLREVAEYRQDMADELNAMDTAISGKVDIDQGVSQAGKVLGVGSDGKVRTTEASSDGNTLNLGQQESLAAAIASVDQRKRKPGRCVTFHADGKWVCKQFTGTSIDDWLTEALWKDYGGGGSLAGLAVNGQSVTPDEEGGVELTMVTGVKLNGTELAKDSTGAVNIPIDTITVDETLDTESTNPVRNSAVATKMNELKEASITSLEIEPVEKEDGTTAYNLVLGRQYGTDMAVELPATGGGGGGSSAVSRIVLRASVDKAQVKEGGRVLLTYRYDHLNSDNESDGVKATITITVRRGSTTTLQRSLKEVAAGEYELDISDALQAGTMDVYVRAECSVTGEDGATTTQSKQAYTSVSVVQISLATSYDLGEALAAGGYGAQETAVIPWAVTGSGVKTVQMVVDGDEENALNRSQTVSKSGTTNGEFLLSMASLAPGRHSVQLVAEVGGIRSQSIWIDLLRAGGSAPYIGLLAVNSEGELFDTDYPTLRASQYEQITFRWAAYDPASGTATVTEKSGGTTVNTMSVGRTMQTYTNRFNESGEVSRTLECGSTVYPLAIAVSGSAIDVHEAVGSLVLSLKAAGRSNSEANPAQWANNGVQTTFENVDWNVSGWDGESLVLTGGAGALIGVYPFASDPGATGLTVEMEFRVKNPTNRTGDVISCMSGGKGFRITTERMSLMTGGTKKIADDDTGEEIEKPSGVATNYPSGEWQRAAFVIGKRGGDRLMELYVNGDRCAADVYGSGDSFLQAEPVGIRIESGSADVEVRGVNVYTRVLSDDESVDNYIISRPTGSEIYEQYEANAIIEGDAVDIDKLRAKGKGVLRIIRTGGLAELNATNDKKAKFYADVIFYSPYGSEYDFYAKNVLVQIQGTSSTKYPSKNYRITLCKGTGDGPKLYIGAEAAKELAVPGSGVCEADRGNPDNYYKMRPNSIGINIFVCKSDYSDSSMTHNTGSSKLMNDVFKEMGLLTPAQEINPDYRTGFDGMPIDIFSSESADGESVYYGQYNFNNEKKDSGRVYGFDPIYNADGSLALDAAVCCLEFLNNSEKLCNFQVDDDLDAQLDAEFDNAFEFRYPENDTVWNTATQAQKTAIKRLFSWIRSMKPAGAEVATRLQEQNGDDRLQTWVNPLFAQQLEDYFPGKNPLPWYVYTDYFMSVDQRAKNMMLATWDGLHWYLIIFWDADTMLGDRNDIVLAYDYLLTRTTWDAERNKYAFEGHGSWLWNLVLANMGTELSEAAGKMREYLTNERVHTMFDEEQQGNWSQRAYNKSGHFKYIVPQLVGVMKQGELTKYPFMYGLKGSGKSQRHYTIDNRFALLDAKYQCGQYKSDNIDGYVARSASDAANRMAIVSDEPYYYGWGTNNNTYQIGLEAREGGSVELTLQAALTANDPIRVYGASRIRELDLSGMAGKMTGQWNLNKCVRLKRLLLGVATAVGGSWFMVLDNCRLLEEIDLTNQKGASTTEGGKELDLRTLTRLMTLKAAGTELTNVVLAKGAPVQTLVLPQTLTTLRLESLPKLTMDGLTVESYANVETLVVSGCPGIEWETLAGRCGSLQRMRVELGDVEGDGQDLVRLYARNLQGLDAQGNFVSYCALTGRYRLTRFIPDEVKAAYPELEIEDPEYTMTESDESIEDPHRMSNLDNETGYKYGTDYEPSGHILTILSKRFRFLGKITAEGEMTYFPLHDKDSRYYADAEDTANCSAAKLDGTEGDVMVHEPGYWYKGITDFLNKKNYRCWSSRDHDHEPRCPEATVLEYADLQAAGGVRNNYKLLTGKGSLAAAYSSDSSYAVCNVVVSGYKRVRYPTVSGSNFMGAIFVDAEGAIVREVMVETLSGGFEPGMYVIADVPEGAERLYWTIQKSAEFDKVVLSNSTKIEDMEPDWVWHDECAGAAAESSIVGSKLRSVMTANPSVANLPWSDLHYYSEQRGMQQIDYEMHKDIANLFYAKYGTTDSQGQCGYGESSNSQPQNRTASIGMKDTVNPNGATTGAWAWNEADPPQLVSINAVNCMGYQNFFGDKTECMDNVAVNVGQVDGKWVIDMPDGSQRKVKGSTTSGNYIRGIVHGKYMDIIAAQAPGATSTTFYCDVHYYTASVGRVVYRSNYYAYANGGVSCASAGYDASYSSATLGSRLAFRGKLVRAASVAAYKAATEVS